MDIIKSRDGYKICASPSDLAKLIIFNFFKNLLSNSNLTNEQHDSKQVKDYVNKLAKRTVDSKEVEYFTALLDLYYAFEKKCDFCFKLSSKFDPIKHQIRTIENIEKYKDDPPDVIIKYNEGEYPFELKRYRGNINFEDLYKFIKVKIIDHYSGKQNFLISAQPKPGSNIDLGIFNTLHRKLLTEKNQPGYIGLTFNHDNKEIITIRFLPKLNKYSRPYDSEVNLFSDLLNS